MKKSRYTESPIIYLLKELERGRQSRRLPKVRRLDRQRSAAGRANTAVGKPQI